jgi:hypothetical protein
MLAEGPAPIQQRHQQAQRGFRIGLDAAPQNFIGSLPEPDQLCLLFTGQLGKSTDSDTLLSKSLSGFQQTQVLINGVHVQLTARQAL